MVMNKDSFERTVIAYCSGKQVLLVGEGGMNFITDYAQNCSEWRVNRINDVASKVVGLEFVSENVKVIKQLGFDYRQADITKPKSFFKAVRNEKFDVIILIDVIEHLENIGEALKNLRDCLSNDGVILVTTPSPHYFRNILTLLSGKELDVSYDHVVGFWSPHLKQLGERVDLTTVRVHHVHLGVGDGWKWNVVRLIGWYNPEFMDHYLIVYMRGVE